MTVRTRAAVVHQRGGGFTLDEVEIDDPRPREVLVRIVACGICHTDISARDGLFSMRFPAVFGHARWSGTPFNNSIPHEAMG